MVEIGDIGDNGRVKYIKGGATILKWTANKLPEVTQLRGNDILLANVILRITREATKKELRSVQLGALKQMHPLERETAMQKTRERIEILQQHKEEIARDGHISTQKQKEFLPSITPIRAVAYQDYFIVFEGNGRVAALQEVFADAQGMTVDVEMFVLPEGSRIFKDIDRLRKRYKFNEVK